MSDTTTETNGSTPPATTVTAKPSPLIAIREAFEAAGGEKAMDKKAVLKARDELIKAMDAVNAAEAAIDPLRVKSQEAAKVLMTLTGAQPFKYGGTIYNPTSSKNGNVFYRPAGSKDVLDLSK